MIDEVLEIFETNAKSELILNILLFSDMTRWTSKKMLRFIDAIESIVTGGLDSNRVLVSYNPILIRI